MKPQAGEKKIDETTSWEVDETTNWWKDILIKPQAVEMKIWQNIKPVK